MDTYPSHLPGQAVFVAFTHTVNYFHTSLKYYHCSTSLSTFNSPEGWGCGLRTKGCHHYFISENLCQVKIVNYSALLRYWLCYCLLYKFVLHFKTVRWNLIKSPPPILDYSAFFLFLLQSLCQSTELFVRWNLQKYSSPLSLVQT